MTDSESVTLDDKKHPPRWVNVLVAAPLPRQFTYMWPWSDIKPIRGMRVVVPWGSKLRVGIVYEKVSAGDDLSKIKPVATVLDSGVLLSSAWFELMTFCAHYYHYPLGLICLESLPKALKTLSAKGAEPVMVARASAGVEQWRERFAQAKQAHEVLIESRSYDVGADTEKVVPDLSIMPALTQEQQVVVDAISVQQAFAPYLLHGVTGGGKTEVYLRVIARALACKKQVLVLLPEINLTPSAMALYEVRLKPYCVKVLHSKLTETQRTQNWLAAASGTADVLISTRLGVLTPMPHLGLIVVDEEHDPSYKQQEGMKYQARDVALVRAKQSKTPIVLGSATPSLESWHRAQAGHYQLLQIKQRAVSQAQLPLIEIVDTQKLVLNEGLSEPVINAIDATLAADQQCLVFLNRRGYAPQMACDACGWVAGCKHCSAHMVWHKRDNALRCHHCGAGQYLPRACPDCGNQDLSGFGRGTQRIEEALANLFPKAGLIRIDADSTRQKGQMEALLDDAHSGRAGILVGTQMIAKGHDFANIGLVVALNVDMSLYSHAFRAPERLFAQLMQVAGRAGRRHDSARVMIQTRYPTHPLFAALKLHDFAAFASDELDNRRQARMPPFAYQATLRADHKQLRECLEFLADAKKIGEEIADAKGVYLCDPVPLSLMRVADIERAQLLIESESRPALQQFLTDWLVALYDHKTRVKWFIEVDPSEI